MKVLSTLLKAGSLALATLVGSGAALAECTGTNMLGDLAAKAPSIAAEIEDKAARLPYGKGRAWQVSKPGVEPSVVFGTMHLSDPRLLKLPEAVGARLGNADVLALEITEVLDPELMKKKAAGVVKFTAYTDGTTLSDKLSDADEDLVRNVVGERSAAPWFLLKRLRPWAVMGSIALPACEAERKASGQPVLDQALGLRARDAGQQIVGLETMESQMKVMASLPDDLMVEALVETARMAGQLDDVIETMTALYLEGELGTIWAMMQHLGPEGLRPQPKQENYASFQREIIDRRNARMVEAATPLIDKGNAFIAVGALHLPGEKGVINLLKERGYSIAPLK